MKYEVRRRFLPYCLKRLDDGRYVILNRDYKPLGLPGTDWVTYEEHPSAVRLRITEETAASLSYKGNPDKAAIYLYNDGCIPTRSNQAMEAYLDRLAHLMKLSILG